MKQIKYIGLDAHSSTCTFSVIDSNGIQLDNKTIVTNGRLLIDYIKSLGGTLHLALEECELSFWLFDIFKKHVTTIIVADPTENVQYKRVKTDKLDAYNLANLLRGKYLKPVFHNGSDREKLRMLISSYNDLNQEIVRIKNRMKSIKRRTRALTKRDLTDHASFIYEHLQSQLLQLLETKNTYTKKLIKHIRQFKETFYLNTIPGIAFIHAAIIIAQVIDPNRFSNKYKFFSYCGLVKHQRQSGGRNYGSKKIWGNRMLKCVYKRAAQSAIRSNSAFNCLYSHLRNKGLSEKNAHNAIARKIAVLSLTLWRNQQCFRNEIILENLPVED